MREHFQMRYVESMAPKSPGPPLTAKAGAAITDTVRKESERGRERFLFIKIMTKTIEDFVDCSLQNGSLFENTKLTLAVVGIYKLLLQKSAMACNSTRST